MLVSSKKFSKGDVVTMKLVNGDEIVTEIISDNGLSYNIRRPHTVIPSPKGMGLMQSMFTSDPDKEIELNKQHVMMAADSVDEMVKHYIQTTTGIQPITNGGIIS